MTSAVPSSLLKNPLHPLMFVMLPCRLRYLVFSLYLFSANEKEQADRRGHAVWHHSQNTHQEKTRSSTHTWKISQGDARMCCALDWMFVFSFPWPWILCFSWILPPVSSALHPTPPYAPSAILRLWDHLSLPARCVRTMSLHFTFITVAQGAAARLVMKPI